MSGTNTLISDNGHDLKSDIFGGVHIFSCHTDHVLPDIKIRFHEHPYWELSFMLSGSMTTYCDESRIICRDDEYTLFLAPEGTIHRRVFGSEENNCNLSYIFTLSDASVAKTLTNKCKQNGCRFQLSGFSAELLRELRSKFQEQTRAANQLMAHLALLLLLEFLKEHGDLTATAEHDRVFWNKLNAAEKADEIRGFLLSHIDNPDLNGRLTAQFKLSLRQLNRIFRKKWNCSIAEAMDTIKVEQSRSLLLNTEMTVQEVSSRMGFISRAGFYNFFKKHNGMTPAEFRTLQKTKGNV